MEVRLDDIIVTKSGDSDGGENCNLFGQNAAVLIKDGAVANLINAQVVSTAKGASGIFSYGGSYEGRGDGTRIDISDSMITTTGSNSGGIMTTGGGETHADNLTINTSGQLSAPIRSDIGGGKVVVNKGTYVSTGQDSPVVYAMADISIKDSTLTSHCSPGIILRGKNKLTLEDCVLTSNNDVLIEGSIQEAGILIYDPDSTTGLATMSIKGGTINNLKGHLIHATNTQAKITLDDVLINNSDPSDTLISVTNDGWGGSENNVSLDIKNMKVSGNIIVSDAPTSTSSSHSILDLSLSSGTIYTGAINHELADDYKGEVNLTVKQGSRFILTGTSYITSLTNNGRIICGDYDLYVNGEKYDDGGSSYPTEASVVFDGATLTVKDRYGKLTIEQDKISKATTVTIKKSGHITLSGSAINTSIRVASSVKDVTILLSDLTIDNSRYALDTNTDASVIIFEPEASGEIVLQGHSTLIGSDKYASAPKPIVRGTESDLVFSGTGILDITDPMPATLDFNDNYADCFSDYQGYAVFQSGTFNLKTNGDALKAVKGGINVSGATINIEYAGQSAVNVDDGVLIVTEGRLDASEVAHCGISASSIELPSNGSVIISGGYVRLYKIGECGIRVENILIAGGTIDITNIYQHSADAIYVPGNEVRDKITVAPIDTNEDKIRVNYNAGAHHGIEVGKRGMTYSYVYVPKSDEEHEAGVMYTQPASGSISITGGVLNIDTTITGVTTNILLSPHDFEPCSDNIYRVGCPGHGIMSYGTVAISNGVVTINAAGDGINCDGTVVISNKAKVSIPLAYTGIEATDIVVGTDAEEQLVINTDTVNSAFVTITKTFKYTYDDSREEHNHYTIHVTKSTTTNNFYSYSGKIISTIDLHRVITVILRSGSSSSYIKKEYEYRPFGHIIDARGYVYIDGGELELYGPNSPDLVPIQNNDGVLTNKSATMILTGVDFQDKSLPKYGSCVFLQPEEGTWGSGAEFKVDTQEGQPIYRGVLYNPGSFLIFTEPSLVSRKLYTVTIGTRQYLLRATPTLNGGTL